MHKSLKITQHWMFEHSQEENKIAVERNWIQITFITNYEIVIEKGGQVATLAPPHPGAQ